jgi:soluble lytic murein transglycosylase
VQLAAAALKFKEKNYKGAREAALSASQSGIKDFLVGSAAYKLQDWQEATGNFSRAAVTFPLLADYALYNEAYALYRLDRFTAALASLQRISRDFPDSPLTRSTLILSADILFDSKDFKGAHAAYQKYVEKYPSGSDSLSAIYKSALCLEQLGDRAGAATALRTIWLKYPSSAIAVKAENDLRRLSLQGIKVEPYNSDELVRRGTTLYDLGKYDQAAKVFLNLTSGQLPESRSGKYLLKGGQALFKARHYKEAEQALTALLYRKIDRETYEEAYMWLGRALNRNGRDEEAFTAFISLAEAASAPELADRALMEAASIRKNQNRMKEALPMLKKIISTHPGTSAKQSILWEIAWGSFQSGDMKTAVDYFKPLTDSETTREKALYWYGRALAASGDTEGARADFALLLAEFPFGYYAQSYRKEVNFKGEEISLPVTNMCEILPIPSGYERVKALITLGLYDEARRELSSLKKKPLIKNGSLPGLARLYLEMDDYNGAYNLLRNERPQKFEKESSYRWGLCFPLAFREYVAQMAAEYAVPEGLIYAVILAESSFSPTALSPAGAIGLMQLMPATAASVANGGKGEFNADTLTSPKTNIRYGVKHLRDLLTLYKGDRILAVAAYNAGAGNVNRWRKTFGHLRKDEFVENIPFAETREYVKKVISGADIYDRLYKLDNSSGALLTSPRQKAAPVTQKSQTASLHRPPEISLVPLL